MTTRDEAAAQAAAWRAHMAAGGCCGCERPATTTYEDPGTGRAWPVCESCAEMIRQATEQEKGI